MSFHAGRLELFLQPIHRALIFVVRRFVDARFAVQVRRRTHYLSFLKGTPSQTIILLEHEGSPRHGSSWKPELNLDQPTQAEMEM